MPSFITSFILKTARDTRRFDAVGFKVVMILLNSFERFIEYRARKPERIIAQKSKMDKYIDWIRANEDKKGFGMRAFYKRFKITKEEHCQN
jgi:hypothetical protein